MKICQLKAFEDSPTGKVYSGTGEIDLLPGQIISHNGTILGLFKSQKSGDQFQYLLHSTIELPPIIEPTIEGTGVDYSPEPGTLILSEGLGNFVCLHWINQLTHSEKTNISCVIFHEQSNPPFRPAPSRFLTPYLPDEMIASLPLLDDLSIVSRLCCDEFQPGCFEGQLSDLATTLKHPPDNWAGFISQSSHKTLTDQLGSANNLFIY